MGKRDTFAMGLLFGLGGSSGSERFGEVGAGLGLLGSGFGFLDFSWRGLVSYHHGFSSLLSILPWLE